MNERAAAGLGYVICDVNVEHTHHTLRMPAESRCHMNVEVVLFAIIMPFVRMNAIIRNAIIMGCFFALVHTCGSSYIHMCCV